MAERAIIMRLDLDVANRLVSIVIDTNSSWSMPITVADFSAFVAPLGLKPAAPGHRIGTPMLNLV